MRTSVKYLKVSILVLAILSSSCKRRVYWVSGSIEQNPITCASYPELQRIPDETSEIQDLFEAATQTDDVTVLMRYSEHLRILIDHIKKGLRPELTDAIFPVRYIWQIDRRLIRQGDTLEAIVLGFSGLELNSSDIKTESTDTDLILSLNRLVSALEICTLSKSLQALVQVRKTNGKIRYYYRLGINIPSFDKSDPFQEIL